MTKATKKPRANAPPKPVFDMDAVLLSSNTGVCLEEIMHLRWKDYDFESGCLHFRCSPDDSGIKLFLNANMCELMTRRYNNHVSALGHAPRLGDAIFSFERMY